jgi:DNA-binding CsgD family transcriptional regulator
MTAVIDGQTGDAASLERADEHDMRRATPMNEERVASLLERYREHAERFDEISERRALRFEPAPVPVEPEQWPLSLTPREAEVLRLAADGATSEEIAAALHLTEHTVKSHLKRIQGKLGARNRTHAVAVALRSGLIT